MMLRAERYPSHAWIVDGLGQLGLMVDRLTTKNISVHYCTYQQVSSFFPSPVASSQISLWLRLRGSGRKPCEQGNMAESLLLPVVRGVVGKAADALVQSITRVWGVDKDRLKLERHLEYVQSLLADAEAKSETNHAVRTWMKELKAAAYQADDVLDDFQYEALRREAMSDQSVASKCRMIEHMKKTPG
nr:uncharacterized protein LOC117861031 isoform X3 [Setaria viridis]